MKKTFSIFLLSVLMLVSCKQNKFEKKTNLKNDLVENNKPDIIFDTIKQASLPFGNKMLIDNFLKIGSNKEVSDAENELLNIENSKFLKFYSDLLNKSNTPFNTYYKYSQKNILDFGFNYTYPVDSISTSQEFYSLSNRLPDVHGNKVFIFNSINNSETNTALVNNIDLVVSNSKNKIIDHLNLSMSLNVIDEKYNNKFEDFDKYFFIDENYIIHIKYFTGWGDAVRRVFAYVKYKINDSGNLIRYFDEKSGDYKSEIEQGKIVNHTKEGIWKEAMSNFETKFCLKKYHNGLIIGDIEVVTISKSGHKSSIFISNNSFLPVKNKE